MKALLFVIIFVIYPFIGFVSLWIATVLVFIQSVLTIYNIKTKGGLHTEYTKLWKKIKSGFL